MFYLQLRLSGVHFGIASSTIRSSDRSIEFVNSSLHVGPGLEILSDEITQRFCALSLIAILWAAANLFMCSDFFMPTADFYACREFFLCCRGFFVLPRFFGRPRIFDTTTHYSYCSAFSFCRAFENQHLRPSTFFHLP